MHYHGKGNKDRRVRYGPKTARAISRYLRARAKHKGTELPDPWLADRGGKPLKPNGIKIMIKRRGLSAGLTGVHAHRWRHNFAHEWKRAGGDTGDLMLLLGWTSEDMPRHYGEAPPPNVPRRHSCGWGSVNMSDQMRIRRAVEVIMGTVVGLTFLFGFGNVLSLGLRLGVPGWVAPLVAPAVDLSVMGLLLGLRQLTANGAGEAQLKPVRRLLMFCSLVTLALNVADPVIAGEYGKAAFDAVGPLLLIGWSDVGPCLLQGMNSAPLVGAAVDDRPVWLPAASNATDDETKSVEVEPVIVRDDLLERARREDIRHRELHQRPISSEALRQRLRVGSARSRRLVKAVRSIELAGASSAARC